MSKPYFFTVEILEAPKKQKKGETARKLISVIVFIELFAGGNGDLQPVTG